MRHIEPACQSQCMSPDSVRTQTCVAETGVTGSLSSSGSAQPLGAYAQHCLSYHYVCNPHSSSCKPPFNPPQNSAEFTVHCHAAAAAVHVCGRNRFERETPFAKYMLICSEHSRRSYVFLHRHVHLYTRLRDGIELTASPPLRTRCYRPLFAPSVLLQCLDLPVRLLLPAQPSWPCRASGFTAVQVRPSQPACAFLLTVNVI